MKLTYTEEDIMRALEAIANGVSIRQAWRNYGVPRSTLQDRLYGNKSHREAAIPQQKLSAVQKKRLMN